jgi:polar amino acid transport system permease protein
VRIQFDFLAVLAQWPLLVAGVLWTVALSLLAAAVGVGLGIACAWARTHGAPWLKALVGAYVELIRNTPFIVQLFLACLPLGLSSAQK